MDEGWMDDRWMDGWMDGWMAMFCEDGSKIYPLKLDATLSNIIRIIYKHIA
jgi:hypothetical protein